MIIIILFWTLVILIVALFCFGVIKKIFISSDVNEKMTKIKHAELIEKNIDSFLKVHESKDCMDKIQSFIKE